MIDPVRLLERASASAENEAKSRAVDVRDRLNLLDPREIIIEPVTWLVQDRMPFGELTMVDGDGGIGKTTFLLDLAARFTTGAPMPDGSVHPLGNVLILAEEDRDSILRARLQVAGADLSRIRFIKSVGDDERRFTLPRDVPALKLAIEEWEARFVIIDALFNHLDGDLSQNRSQDVRTALMPVGNVAHLTGAAIEATRHIGKSLNTAGNRGLGSVDIKNVCRSLLTVGMHPDDETMRAIAVAKTNLGMPCDALTYRLDSVDVTADDGSTFQVARVAWTGTAPIRADALTLAPPDGEDEKSALEDACERIIEFLSTGSKTAAELEESLTRTVRPITFRRARKRLHDADDIEKTGGGRMGGPVIWRLSENRISSDQIGSHIQTRDSIQKREILIEPKAEPSQESMPGYRSAGPPPNGDARLAPGSKMCVRCKRLGRCFELQEGHVCRDCIAQANVAPLPKPRKRACKFYRGVPGSGRPCRGCAGPEDAHLPPISSSLFQGESAGLLS